jgi:hypothetical protein
MVACDWTAIAKADAIYAQHRAAMFAEWAAEDLMRGHLAKAMHHQAEAASWARLAQLSLTAIIIGDHTYRAVSARFREG